jgi:predicted NUDIX family phosphoesterase
MEFVYVVDRRDLFDLAFPHGFVGAQPPPGLPDLESYGRRIAERGYFVERAFAEQRSWIKQIIPYTLVVHEGGDGDGDGDGNGDAIFVVRRLEQGGERRLHGKRSLGIGGHINPEDDAEADRRGLAGRCARRELSEELIIDTPYDLRPAGVINDDANPVGSVHFGLVQVARVESRAVRIREQDTLEGSFLPVSEVKALLTDPEANLETWSSLIIAQLDAVLSA